MTKICLNCQTGNRDTAVFCNRCGYAFPAIGSSCSACGLPNASQAKFCRGCGSPLTKATIGNHLPPSVGGQSTPNVTGMLSSKSRLGQGRYMVLKRIGQGGMAAVYLAEDTRLGAYYCAIKEMSDASLNPQEKQKAIAAFHHEAKTMASLSHPHLPRVTDSFHEQGKEYLVMDFIEGETLEDRINHAGGQPLPEKDVVMWALQLCNVLSYLHSQHPKPIIFRDLKPANIMLDKTNQIKLIDFGIVRFFTPGQAKDTTKFGSPGYAPPEQYGKGQTDARSDVYALGATIHHMLTGRDPSSDPFKFPPISNLNSRICRDVDVIVAKSLEAQQEDRWPDMNAFRQALEMSSIASSQTAASQSGMSQGQSASFQSAIPLPPIPKTTNMPAPPSVNLPPKSLSVPASVASQGSVFLDTDVMGRRAIALLIDGMVLTGLSFIYLFIARFLELFIYEIAYEMGWSTYDLQIFVFSAIVLFQVILYLGYYTVFHAWRGQTPGKMVMGIEVVRPNGSRPSWGRSLWRAITLVATTYAGLFLCLGIVPYAVPFSNPSRRAVHDYLAGTFVSRR